MKIIIFVALTNALLLNQYCLKLNTRFKMRVYAKFKMSVCKYFLLLFKILTLGTVSEPLLHLLSDKFSPETLASELSTPPSQDYYMQIMQQTRPGRSPSRAAASRSPCRCRHLTRTHSFFHTLPHIASSQPEIALVIYNMPQKIGLNLPLSKKQL